MSHAPLRLAATTEESLPTEMMELWDRIQVQPASVRAELEPLIEDVLENARFRGRVLNVARDALERLKLDLEVARFDLDATRRERESLRQLLDQGQ
ncbi:hypothetical protein [Singulisphaera sp. PoT]|uniref:hypothetical protein n=1 Tax=Singulisphaera sp. PoT TaxID=3411797 RepID=UPI003BF52DA9